MIESFQPEKLRPEVEVLQKRVEELEGQLKKEKLTSPEAEESIIKQEIKDYLKELQQAPVASIPIKTRDEAKEIKQFPINQQVNLLISLALGKGLKKAISVAQEIDNPAVLDEFHDTLIDRYYKELIEKKIIKG